MTAKLDSEVEETKKLGVKSLKYHSYYKGKVHVELKCPVRSLDDFSVWYTPGVASASLEIAKDQDLSYEYTNRGNLIAIASDGSRVLGLGNVGPYAALPVMEGKALLYKYLGGVDAFPVVLQTHTADELVSAVLNLQPSFGGVNLEDIEAPKCFAVLEQLREKASIPVWHDDQQGTATVTLAALINALKVAGKKLQDVTVAMVGAGAASLATARLLQEAGLPAGNIVMCDSAGILHPDREDMDKLQLRNHWKYDVAIRTNKERKKGGIAEALEGADVCISAATPGPGVIKKEWVSRMQKDAIVFALANPTPEIWPREAKEAGARVVATGRSDFPNQVNNSLVFPAVFRGSLDVRSKAISDEMCIAAANALSSYAERTGGISEEHIIPTMEDWEVYAEEAAAVGDMAIRQGLARIKMPKEELKELAYAKIERVRKRVKLLMKEGLIPPPPE
ncbi:MAG: NADP-dependent malic enzyme [Conexivisphaerales archaeon]